MSQTADPITLKTAAKPSRKRPPPGAIAIERHPSPAPVPAAETLRFGQTFTDHMFLADYRAQTWQSPRVVPFAPLAFSPAAAGLHYGQCLFEGCKAFRGVDGKLRLFRLDRHIARMARGAARLCMPAPDARLMQEAVTTMVTVDQRFVPDAAGTALYLRPTLIATEAFLGVRPAAEYAFFIIASPVTSYFGSDTGPLRLKIEETFTRAAPGGLGAIKAAANYAASLQAAEVARAEGFHQVLWTDALEHSAIEEAGTMNVFVQIGDEICTPPLRGTILAGVTRASVIELLTRDGRRVRERAVTAAELLEARRTGRLREMFGTGTGAGIAPIGELHWQGERIVVGDGGEGPVARRLMPRLREIQTGAAPDPGGWMTEVAVGLPG
ncbi:MAG TPA: branched-chain amino acid aminotransferase [Polyangia bacterium]